MSQHMRNINPRAVTKPFQLVAAILIALFAVASLFLAAARAFESPTWLRPLLVIAAVATVPVFILFVFVLQTRFRAEMQEDAFYARHLNRRGKDAAIDVAAEMAQLRATNAASDQLILDRVDVTHAHVRRIADAVLDLQQRALITTGEGRAFRSLKDEVLASGKQLERTRQEIKWTRVGFLVNDLLPRYPEVRDVLGAMGVPSARLFGSNSSYPIAPGLFVMAFGRAVPPEDVMSIIVALRPFGLQAVGTADSDNDQGSIVLGSYAYHFDPVTWLTDEVVAVLSQCTSSSQKFIGALERRARRLLPAVHGILLGMSANEEAAVRAFFGLDGTAPLSEVEVSELTGISGENLRSLLLRTLPRFDQALELPSM